MTRRIKVGLCFLVAALALVSTDARAARLKELVDVEGFRANHLIGVGLVVGLDRTGDRPGDRTTQQTLANLLRHLDNRVSPTDIRARNVAVVMVTGELPPFIRPGARLDVTVSSMGSATSLQGGTLLAVSLRGLDRRVYAVAQGPLMVGGYEAESRRTGSFRRKNHVTVARIPHGAIVERDVPQTMPTEKLRLILKDPDFTTAYRIEQAIEQTLSSTVAEVPDPGVVEVTITAAWKDRIVGLIATLESVEATPDAPARVIIDERTGTVVAGAALTMEPAALAYGGMEVRVDERLSVSQPQAFGQGDTVVIPESDIEVTEKEGRLVVLPAAATVGQLVTALNALNVKPRDLVAIFQALHKAGALRAEVRSL